MADAQMKITGSVIGRKIDTKKAAWNETDERSEQQIQAVEEQVISTHMFKVSTEETEQEKFKTALTAMHCTATQLLEEPCAI